MKKIFSILICAGLCTCLLAGPADPRPQQFTQPDGSTVTVYLYGDEYLNWMTDESGDVVEVGEDGFLRRGEMPSRELITKASFRRQNANIGLRSGTQTGTRHFLVVLVDYPDCPFITTKEQFEDFFNGSGAGSTDSVQNYYIEQSDGQFTPVFDIFGPVTVSNNRAYYKEKAKDALSEAIGQLVNADTDPLNLGNYISSSWGILEYYIDDVVMIFAGHSRASGDNDGIWPSQQTGTIYNKGKNYVKSFCCAPELQGKSGNTMAGIGHVCHEFGHCMGLPDFYADDFTHACLDFSLMGSGSYRERFAGGQTPKPIFRPYLLPEILPCMRLGRMPPRQGHTPFQPTKREKYLSANTGVLSKTSGVPDLQEEVCWFIMWINQTGILRRMHIRRPQRIGGNMVQLITAIIRSST